MCEWPCGEKNKYLIVLYIRVCFIWKKGLYFFLKKQLNFAFFSAWLCNLDDTWYKEILRLLFTSKPINHTLWHTWPSFFLSSSSSGWPSSSSSGWKTKRVFDYQRHRCLLPANGPQNPAPRLHHSQADFSDSLLVDLHDPDPVSLRAIPSSQAAGFSSRSHPPDSLLPISSSSQITPLSPCPGFSEKFLNCYSLKSASHKEELTTNWAP